MAKLFKHEWKYYLAFFILLTIILLYATYTNDLSYFNMYDIDFILYNIDDIFVYTVYYTIIIFTVFKTCFAILESNSSYRYFLQTLPVSSRMRLVFHIIMDIGTILLSYLIMTLIVYFKTASLITNFRYTSVINSEIYYSIITNSIVSILYLICIMAIYYVISSVVVIGWAKIAFSFAFYVALMSILSLLPDFVCNLAGRVFSPIRYDYDYLTKNDYTIHTNDSFASVSIIYIYVAAILIAAAIWLCSKQDESKELFYISWMKYVFSAILALCFFAFYFYTSDGFTNATTSGIIIMLLVQITIFLLFSYLLTPDRQKPVWQKKLKTDK